MHELSIALDLIDAACETAAQHRSLRVHAVHVRIGPLAGLLEDALAFSFDLAAAGTVADGAALVVEQAPLVAFCHACAQERTLASPQHLRCPVCRAFTPEIRSGRELEVIAVEIADDSDSLDPSEHPEKERSDRC